MGDQQTFVSSYSWLVAPGDHLQVDYTTPTRVKTWLQASSVTVGAADKQVAYGQWIAQLLHNQLGVDILSKYGEPHASQWPITLRNDVIMALDAYFDKHK